MSTINSQDVLDLPRNKRSAPPTTFIPESFCFVPVTQGDASKGRAAAKRIVRAHVTRMQHAKTNTMNGMDLQSWTVNPNAQHEPNPVRRKPRRKGQSGDEEKDRARVTRRSSSQETVSSSLSRTSISRSGASTSSSGGGSTDLVPFSGVDNPAEDPFFTFPLDYHPEISPIIAHYIQNIAVDMEDLDGPNDKGLIRKELFPLCMTEAATMYAVLLMGASHYCIVHPSRASLVDLLAIKARALTEINKALADPDKATTDATIMAVAKLAACESIFGDSEVFSAHMRGLQMMLKMRGGLRELGLNGFLERMLVWIDLNASHLTGREVHLGTKELPSAVSFDAPDPFHFAGIQ